MKFLSISITNMFSYYGKNTLSLNESKNCNITVLMGRNGYGKTSFINSVKMLFLDISKEIRSTIQRRRIPTPKQFVLGIKNEWWGILNQRAKQEGTKQCSVSAVWQDTEGFEVHATRQWDIHRASYESSLIVTHDLHGKLQDDEAEDFLENALPKSFLPFFFFDGEQVQELAEANDNEIIQKMELLLNIRPLENMQDALSELAKEWRRKGENEEARSQLKKKESEIEEKETQYMVLNQKINDLVLDIDEYQEQLKKIDRKLRWLRGGVMQEAEIELKESIKVKEEARENILDDLAQAWKQDAMLTVQSNLIRQAVSKLEKLIHSKQGQQEELVETIKSRLNDLFISRPFSTPRLTENQADFYKQRMLREIDAVSVVAHTESSFKLSHEHGKKLFVQLSKYTSSSHLAELQKKAKKAQVLWKEIHDLNNKLKATGKLSEAKQQEYNYLLNEEKNFKDKLLQDEVEKATKEKERETVQKRLSVYRKDLEKFENVLHIATAFRQQHDFTLNLKKALDEVKKKLKKIKREELEESYNQKLLTLLDSHSLIKQITINNDFEIAYHDNQGQEIGMSTISAGMKQLSATALLWALKDISGREFPIIIDTPMGRIDAKHQENLLKKYYPNVGRQVILLPTDSELDERKYKILKPHISQFYQLSNSDGRSSKINRKGYKHG